MGLKLMAELGLDGSGFEAGFKRAEGLVHGVAEGLKGFVVQAVGVLTVEAAISKTVETAKELVETSKRLAVAPEQLQVLRQAAKQSGVELGELASAFEKIDIAREKALLPGKEGRQQRMDFGKMGISGDMLHSQTAAQLFMGPMSSMAKNRNPEEFGALLRDLGIREFGQLIPILKQDFGELSKKMNEMGAIMSTEAAVAIKGAADEMSMLSQVVVSQLAPALVAFAEGLYKTVQKVAGFSAFLGGGTAKLGAAGTAKALLGTAGFAAQDIFARLFQGRTKEESRAFMRSKMGSVGFDVAAGQAGANAAEAPWAKSLAAIKKRIEEEANELKNPKRADFRQSSLPDKVPMKAFQIPGDALTHVGNFLGGMGITARIEERKVNLLQQIAHNTAQRGSGGGATGHGGMYGGFNSSSMGLAVPHG